VWYVLGVLLGNELDGSLDLRLHVSGRVLRYARVRYGVTRHVHQAWCLFDAPATARRKGLWEVASWLRVV
jgi:hypothetical protein